jgi:hypothetical protein
MKVMLSVSLKLTLMVVIVSIIALFALTSVIIDNQNKYIEEQKIHVIILHQDTLSALISDFNSSLCKIDNINSNESLNQMIENFTDRGIRITKININTPNYENKLVVKSSNISQLIGEYADPYFVERTEQLSTFAVVGDEMFNPEPINNEGEIPIEAIIAFICTSFVILIIVLYKGRYVYESK